MNALYQLLFVFSVSRKLQWAVVLAFASPPILLALLLWYVDGMHFSGTMAPFFEPVKQAIREHYGKEVLALFVNNVF